MHRIKILFVHGGILSRGGTESFMMNVFRNIDPTRFQIDFLVFGRTHGAYDAEVCARGSKIYRLPVHIRDLSIKDESVLSIFKQIKHESYDIVHAHMNALNGAILWLMKYMKIQHRISHCHSSMHLADGLFATFIQNFFQKRINKYATALLACSQDAGHFLYGSHPFEVVYNGIDLERFAYNEQVRKDLRKELDIEDKFVVGHIGRFSSEKNHRFLIDVFKELKTIRSNAYLILVGSGPLETEIRQQVARLNLSESVMFTGVQETACLIIQALDVFALPSLFEGLPYVLVEAQCSGLHCICSDTISLETKLTDIIKYLPLTSSKQWAQVLNESQSTHRHSKRDVLDEKGYNVVKNVHWLQSYYDKQIGAIAR